MERRLHNKMLWYGKYKRRLKSICVENLKPENRERYKLKLTEINKAINDTKAALTESINQNTAVRELSPSALCERNVISVFESTLTRVGGFNIGQLTTDIMVVQTYFYGIIEQLIKYGFTYDGCKYQYLTSSAGQIRTKKTVFIKGSLWDNIKDSIMCGLSIDRINAKGGINANKYLAYMALSNSATDLWDDFDIDRCIVVPDFETSVRGEVDFVDDVTYKIERRTMDVPIPHTDGCGMILPSVSKKNFMVRLPWMKGLLAVFNFRVFIKEYDCSPVVKDIYGKEWDIFKDDIKIIFTESQFKMAKYYDSWDEYKENFKKHHCQAGVCNVEEDFFPDATLNYQMIQTLTDITDEEIETIASPSQSVLKNLSSCKDAMLKVFGVTPENTHKTKLQQALEIYPELLQDEHCKHILRQIKKSLTKNYKSGKLKVKGKYMFLVPDLYAFCEWLFMGIENPKGLLDDGEVFCWLYRNVPRLSCLRSPHLYREWANRNNVIDNVKRRWFKTNAIYTSTHDLISKILQFDVDGDKSLVVSDETLVKIADRNIANDDIVPLYYDMKKSKPVHLDADSIYDGLNAVYKGGNIGIYSNNISKIWNGVDWQNCSEEERKEALDCIRILCMENNFVIDYAKTLYKPERPQKIDSMIKQHIRGKLPHFFMYAKDKTRLQVEECGCSVVDKLDSVIKPGMIRFKAQDVGKFRYTKLMKNSKVEMDEDIINAFVTENRGYHFKINRKNRDNIDYIILTLKNKLLDMGRSAEDVSDMLVKHMYSKSSPYKDLLWDCFGDIIVANLKTKIKPNSVQCVRCGARFTPNAPNQKLCVVCSSYTPAEKRTVMCADCGQKFVIDGRSARKIRCDHCQYLARLESKRLYARKRRSIDKSQKKHCDG